jgi:GT2 family glycosyltransferase
LSGVPGVSLVIPTYRRERVLIETIRHIRALDPPPDEVIVVDQTTRHEPDTNEELARLAAAGTIRWLRLERPSIPHAMNIGLLQARGEIVLFTDDDVVPDRLLIAAHRAAHAETRVTAVAGRVYQPWDRRDGRGVSAFTSEEPRAIDEFMGGNVSVKRLEALRLGGFDENFVKAAYRFEREFSARVGRSGRLLVYAPAAIIHNVRAETGGTRAHGQFWYHPGHGVGEHYYFLRTRSVPRALMCSARRILRAPISRRHLRAPWLIPVTLAAETVAFLWAVLLVARGPRYFEAVEAVGRAPGSSGSAAEKERLT